MADGEAVGVRHAAGEPMTDWSSRPRSYLDKTCWQVETLSSSTPPWALPRHLDAQITHMTNHLGSVQRVATSFDGVGRTAEAIEGPERGSIVVREAI